VRRVRRDHAVGAWRNTTFDSIVPQEYVGMPEETVVSRRNLWFHTGDLLRQDRQGWLYFMGRTKEAMRYRGENVSAFEVENALLSLAHVAEAAVYAVPSEFGEDEIVAAVVLTEVASHVDFVEMTRRISAELPYFAVPRFFRVVDQLPRNGSQRVVKSTLVEEGVPEGTWDRQEAGVVVERNSSATRHLFS
jgi:crotonobetaine/carnitine-CoA ligase